MSACRVKGRPDLTTFNTPATSSKCVSMSMLSILLSIALTKIGNGRLEQGPWRSPLFDDSPEVRGH